MDVTPPIPGDRQVIDSYGASGFRVSGVLYEGAILVRPGATERWAPRSMEEVTAESLGALTGAGIDLLLLGCGPRMALPPPALRRALRAAGIVLETMDTGAACRTYNVLLSEDRRVAAALLPAG